MDEEKKNTPVKRDESCKLNGGKRQRRCLVERKNSF